MGHRARLAILVLAAGLAGCGLSDSQTKFMPAMFRQPDPPQRLPEPPPDVRALVQADLNDIFLDTAHPSNVQISPPQPGIVGVTWIACIKANITGVAGNPIGVQTLQLEIAGGKIRDRRRADEAGPCSQVSYEPL
jgi:hypothetical protein